MGEETIMQTDVQQRWNVWAEMKSGKTRKNMRQISQNLS